MDPHQHHADAMIIAALQKVNLWTWLQDRGGLDAGMTTDTMSQGQQQLLSLARALLRCGTGSGLGNGSVLLLDEATSNMDGETNEMVQGVIQEEFKGWTVIMVSHRLTDVVKCDVVVVMGEGRVIEVGEPDVLRRSGGAFAQLLAST
jgi:ATP-binding cassette subfamily C (CFTR/MRP) protein 1